MKTIRNLILPVMLLVLGLAFTSCEDESISSTLEGTWEGNTYMSSVYNGRIYNSSYSYVDFTLDPFRFTKGSGHWVDYYSNAPWDYIASHIDWQVRNGVIEVHFVEDGYTVYISNYRLNRNRFVGTIYLDDSNWQFNLVHTSSPNWSDYDYGYWAPSASGASSRPQRILQHR